MRFGGFMAVVVATTAFAVGGPVLAQSRASAVSLSEAQAAQRGMDLCDLYWVMAGAACVLIGLVWLVIVGIIAVAGLVSHHRRRTDPPPPSDPR